VCLEAMAARCPVICLNLGGPPVLVGAGGIVVDAVDAAATERQLADAMVRLSGDPDLCRRMGEAGRRQLVERYLWRNKARHYSAIYEKVLGRK
jgi:glycosyltransferase involved in cell wall biosynthesis